ncbi:MAG: SufD family Fe-S cluster assembly protein [Oscillospiraceae bacterium]|jgi:Fe-S cluster assembly scaffold protein SufB|nr:SufD family Fe-S cluster assembly protein [Oscillospiraceae bacterium]
MPTTIKNINKLPVRTWRRLGVNGETLTIDFPEPGRFDTPKTVLPQGVTRAHESVLVCAEFTSALNSELAAFTRVHANTGVQIRVKKGVKAAEPIVARYALGADSPTLTDNNVIFAEAHSEVTLVMIYDGDGTFHSGITRVIAENCAVVRVAQINTLGANTQHFSDFSAVIANGARVELSRIELGGKSVYAGCHMKLEGDKAECGTDTFYFGDGDRKLDFNYVAKHLGKSSRSDMNASGALFGYCEKTYRGTIDFVAGASEAKGAEAENTLLFSENSRNRSAPLILCGEENVEGSHAASVGRIDANKLYYLQSRGLSEAEAKRLMVSALMETAMKNIPEEERERLRGLLGERI